MRLNADATFEYVRVPWYVDADPTADDVEIAIVDLYGRPGADWPWLSAEWEPGQSAAPWWARVGIGTESEADVTLVAGRPYAVWSRVIDDPEEPGRRTGILFAT